MKMKTVDTGAAVTKKIRKGKSGSHPVQLREKLVPGTVVILLLGAHAGKRVVFLKNLGKSGNLLVAGPHSVNRVPLRRIGHRHVIATGLKLDISSLNLEKYDDAYFKKPAAPKKKKDESIFMSQGEDKVAELSDSRKADNAEVDKVINALIQKSPVVGEYLKTRFSLSKGECLHQMTF